MEEVIKEGTLVEALAETDRAPTGRPLPWGPGSVVPAPAGMASEVLGDAVNVENTGAATSTQLVLAIGAKDELVLEEMAEDTPENELAVQDIEWENPREGSGEPQKPSLRDRLMEAVMQTPRRNCMPWMKLPSAERFSRTWRRAMLDRPSRGNSKAPVRSLFQGEEGFEKGGSVEEVWRPV